MSFVRKLLNKKIEGRLGSKGANECKAQPFLKALDWKALEQGTMPRPYVPLLAGETDVRYFDKRFTSSNAPLSASEFDASAEVARTAEAAAAAAKKAEFKERERERVAKLEAEAKAASDAKKAAAEKADADAKDAKAQAAADAASEAAKKVRAAQKKLRQATDLQEQRAAGGELNRDQKDKIKTIPKLQAELSELEESAAQLEEASQLAAKQRADEVAKERALKQAEAAWLAKDQAETQRKADEQRKEEEAKRGGDRGMVEQMKKMDVVATMELLGVEKFNFVAPDWR